MKLRYCLVLGLLVILFFQPCPLSGQSSDKNQQQNYFGFDSLEWKKISKRYERHQKRADIILKRGDTITGQVLLTTEREFAIYPGYELFMFKDYSDKISIIEFSDIDKIRLLKESNSRFGKIAGGVGGGFVGFISAAILGYITESPAVALVTFSGSVTGGIVLGAKIQKNIQSKEYVLEGSNSSYDKDLQSIRNSSFFQDSIIYQNKFIDLVNSSAALQDIFPQNKYRISVSSTLGREGLKVTSDLDNVMESAILRYRSSYMENYPVLSISVARKINKHFYAGLDLYTSPGPESFFYTMSDSIEYYISTNSRNLTGARLYFEYTPLAVERYFTKRSEVLFGAGLIIGSYKHDTHWSYVEYDPDNPYGTINKPYVMSGLLARASLNIYLSPSLSISGGVEGYFFRDIKIPATNMLFPDSYSGFPTPIHFEIPEYHLNFTTIKINMGVHFYF